MKKALVGEINHTDIATANTFQPKENRLLALSCTHNQIFFDGEVTNAARLKALGDSLYAKRILALHQVEFYEQDLESQKSAIIDAFGLFNEIYLNTAIDQRFATYIEDCLSSFANVVRYSHSPGVLDNQATIFVHWGAYWREADNDQMVLGTF